jgi:hypothetical protein
MIGGRLDPRVLFGLLAAICVGGFALIVVAADQGMLPAGIRRLYNWPGGDKVGHVVLLAVVSGAVGLAVRARSVRFGRWSLPLAGVVVGVVITLEELSQIWLPGRSPSLVDLACSYLGVVLGTWAAAAVLRARFGKASAAAPFSEGG